MSRYIHLVFAGSLLVLAGGCADLTAPELDLPPDSWELPDPDSSLDPARLSVGDFIATPCMFGLHGSGTDHLDGRDEWATVDVFFGRESEAGPWDGPTAADVGLVEAHGGRVLHAFNVPGVRARMVLSRIPALVEEGFWVTVRDVPDATRYDVPVSVGFDRPLSDADVELFGALGGAVEYRWESIRALAGPLPDRSIDDLQARSDVVWVEHSSVACLG